MKKGFTIIELLISISIIGILASLGYKSYTSAITSANATSIQSQLDQIKSGLANYYKDTGSYPTNLTYLISNPSGTGFDSLSLASGTTEDDGVKDYWSGPYISGMVASIDKPHCLKSVINGNVCLGVESTWTGDKAHTELTSESNGNDSTKDTYYNVLIVDKVEMPLAKKVYELYNGVSPQTSVVDDENWKEIAKGSATSLDKYIGLSSIANFSKNKSFIFRYTDLY
jgi:prepilin-type N-terminal cleavage/methylation domain-containing protein